MTTRTKIELRRSEIRSRLGDIAKLTGDDLTEEIQGERDGLMTELSDTEPQLRAAIEAEGDELETRSTEYAETPEVRARLELRSNASLGRFLEAAIRGRQITGAEAELQQEAGVDGIPLELFETRTALEQRQRINAERRDISPAPETVGINLDVIRPMVFAPSVADKLMIEMPMVTSGTYATGTIDTSATADAVKKSAEVPQSAASIKVGTASPKRVGASLGLTLEDIAAVGQQNFESVLRDNVSLALSDELDNQMLNGDGTDDDVIGIIKRLETINNPDDPGAVADFDAFVAAYADAIDGLWATMMNQVSIVAGVDTFKLSAKTFRDRVIDEANKGAASLGSISAADYLRENTAGWWTNKRMPAVAGTIQRGVVCRKGRPGIRTAVCPHWGSIGIDDIYSGARKGERYFTLSVLVGDVLLVQADAYTLAEYKVS